MAKLTTKTRKALPNSSFAGPHRSYPVNDRSHAANAKARAEQQYEKGNLSSGQKASIDAKANKVLHGGGAHHDYDMGNAHEMVKKFHK